MLPIEPGLKRRLAYGQVLRERNNKSNQRISELFYSHPNENIFEIETNIINEYDSEYDSEYISEYDSEYSEYDSEYDSNITLIIENELISVEQPLPSLSRNFIPLPPPRPQRNLLRLPPLSLPPSLPPPIPHRNVEIRGSLSSLPSNLSSIHLLHRNLILSPPPLSLPPLPLPPIPHRNVETSYLTEESLHQVYLPPPLHEELHDFSENNYETLLNLKDVKVGLINKALLEKSTVKQSKNMVECSICKEDIFLDIIRELNCRHYFHINCIDIWLTENSKCPLCRHDLREN